MTHPDVSLTVKPVELGVFETAAKMNFDRGHDDPARKLCAFHAPGPKIEQAARRITLTPPTSQPTTYEAKT